MSKQQQSGKSAIDHLVIKQPLQLYREKKRRYVRLEIAAPIIYSVIDLDRPLSDAHTNQLNGTMLNISGGGVLMVTDQQLREGEYLTISLELAGSDLLTGVAGKVKRVDEDGEGGYLVGVEFCTENELAEVFGQANIGSVISSFDDRVKRFLLRYIFARKVQDRLSESENDQSAK
jgi:c-di-GMP-binding flagellar brake protein YcgR